MYTHTHTHTHPPTPLLTHKRHAFEVNFSKDLECGAQCVVYQGGKKVADLHGCNTKQPQYNADTMQCVFGCGQVIEAIVMAMLVDRGLLVRNVV